MLQLPPLYGGGYCIAFLQIFFVYYGASIAIHWLGPLVFPVKSIQVQPRQPGQVRREAINSLGKQALSSTCVRAPFCTGTCCHVDIHMPMQGPLWSRQQCSPSWSSCMQHVSQSSMMGPFIHATRCCACLLLCHRGTSYACMPSSTPPQHANLQQPPRYPLHVQVLCIIATMAALDYLHDAWFYWTHRLLHSRMLYKHVHAVHHRWVPCWNLRR